MPLKIKTSISPTKIEPRFYLYQSCDYVALVHTQVPLKGHLVPAETTYQSGPIPKEAKLNRKPSKDLSLGLQSLPRNLVSVIKNFYFEKMNDVEILRLGQK